MKIQGLTDLDLRVLKYYKEGFGLCGFEGVHNNLCDEGYLDDDLDLTEKGYDTLSSNDFSNIEIFNDQQKKL